MRIMIIFLIVLCGAYLFIKGRTSQRSSEKPIFLQVDEIGNGHQTLVSVFVESDIIPDSTQIQMLRSDYSRLWAHLNHFYQTNDVVSGKEYYTEKWFKAIAGQYQGKTSPIIRRKDLSHELYIKNWSDDGLVCTAIDSNLVLTYTKPDLSSDTICKDIAIVLLFQGDHWRIDAMKVLE